MDQSLSMLVLDAQNATRDLSKRFNNLQANMQPVHDQIRKVAEYMKWRNDNDTRWAQVIANHKENNTPLNEEDQANLDAYRRNRKSDDEILDKFLPAVVEFRAAYQNLLGITNIASRARVRWDEIALIAAKEETRYAPSSNPFLSGLQPDVTKPSPEAAREMQLSSEAKQDIQRAAVPKDVTGPSL